MEQKAKKMPLRCPSCDAVLHVSRLHCQNCDTEVSGNFDLPFFAQMSTEEMNFVIQFVKSSGSLKDMAKTMGVSYPTVRNILDDLIVKLNQINH